MDSQQFRRALATDAEQIVALLVEAWPAMGAASEGLAVLYSRRLTDDRMAWVSDVGGLIEAAAVADLLRPGAGRVVADDVADVELNYMVVTEDRRGEGLGTALERVVVSDMIGMGLHLAVLDVESHNELAKRFWTRTGWSYRCDEPNPGSGGAYRAVFTRSLAPPGQRDDFDERPGRAS